LCISAILAITTFIVAGLVGSGQSLPQNAYITNNNSNTVSVIDTATNTVTGSITGGRKPFVGSVSRDGNKGYVTAGPDVSVIDAATNSVIGSPIIVGNNSGVAVTPDGSKVYVTQNNSNTVQ